MDKTIEQSVTFSGTPHEVYEILMDEKKHAALIGDEASVSREVGGAFAVYGGSINGETVKLVPGEKIVQRWRAGNWPEGHYSTATFEFEAVADGTRLTFTQTDVPDEHYESIVEGWEKHYWMPLEVMLAG
jgi:activator of HSP90 ATPase